MLLGLGIVLGFASIGILCWLLFLCAVYAAPLFVAAMVCTMLYDHAMMSGAHAIPRSGHWCRSCSPCRPHWPGLA